MDLYAGDGWLGSEQCWGVERSNQIRGAGVRARVTGGCGIEKLGLGVNSGLRYRRSRDRLAGHWRSFPWMARALGSPLLDSSYGSGQVEPNGHSVQALPIVR